MAVTVAFIDELNNSDIGKRIRYEHGLELSQESLDKINKILNKTVTVSDIKNNGLTNYPTEVKEMILNENLIQFTIENFQDFIGESIILFDTSQEDLNILSKITTEKKFKKITLLGLSDKNLIFEDLNVDNLILSGDIRKIDFTKLKSVKGLSLKNVNGLENIKIFENLEELQSLEISSEECIDLSEIALFHDLQNIHLSFDKQNKDITQQEIEKIITLPNIETVYVNGSVPLIINNLESLIKLSDSKLIKNEDRIFYSGNEKIPAELIEKLSSRNINLTVKTPTVFDEKTCKNLQDKGLQVSIANDNVSSYNFGEISAINDKINELLTNAPRNGTELEKIVYIYSKIIDSVQYDYAGIKPKEIDNLASREYEEWSSSAGEISRSLKGALLDGKVVCYGYALLLNVLANELDLNCKMIEGMTSEDIKQPDHEWNQVQVDGKWYNLDVTWDAGLIQGGEKNLQYFLLSDKNFPDHFPCGARPINSKEFNYELEPCEICNEDYNPQLVQKTFTQLKTSKQPQDMRENLSDVSKNIRFGEMDKAVTSLTQDYTKVQEDRTPHVSWPEDIPYL